MKILILFILLCFSSDLVLANEKIFNQESQESQASNPCAQAAEDKDAKELKTLKDCQDSCHGVCRWEKKIGTNDCYECPSGSPDTCWDVNAWPANHPWCQPGGICYDDQMLYCTPFGTWGPNKMPLNCTLCKERKDECFQKVAPDTLTYTRCKQACWDGECVFKGKYQEKEWDGKPEYVHCYECKMPPPPPTCEDLGWGWTWKNRCEENCKNGQCKLATITVGPNGQPVAGDGLTPPAQGAGAQPGNATPTNQGKDTKGSTNPANPPGGSPQQPSGGGASSSNAGGAVNESPQPPGTDTEFYRQWLEETKKRIKSREDILKDPKEFAGVKEVARRQLDDMTQEKQRLEEKIKKAEEKEAQKQKEIEDAKKQSEEYEKNRPKSEDYREEVARKDKEGKLKQLKEVTDNLQIKIKEAQEAFNGRKEHLDKIKEEIDTLQKKNEAHRKSAEENRLNSDYSRARISENDKKIKELTDQFNELSKKFDQTMNKYNEDIEKLKSEYRKAYWQYNENARRKAEMQRMNEYMEKYDELRRTRKLKELRDKAFEDLKKTLTDKTAIENLTRGQAQWDEQQDKRIKYIEEDLYRTGTRNFDEGAGPFSVENLAEKYRQYIGYVDKNIEEIKEAFAQGTITKAQADEQIKKLNSFKEDVVAQQNYYKSEYPLSEEEANKITESATRIAQAAVNTNADISFARLFVESLGEEMVNNANPLTATKKGLNFAYGFGEGVVKVAGGIITVGYNVGKTLAQGAAYDLGYEDFGTDNFDALLNMGSTLSGNLNLNGLMKATLAAGKSINDKMDELQRGDIDAGTARFGGEIAGEVVALEAAGTMAHKALGKAVKNTRSLIKKAETALKGTQEAAETARVAERASETLRVGEKVRSFKEPAVETSPVETHGPPKTKTLEAPKGEIPEELNRPKAPETETNNPRAPPENKPPKAGEYDSSKALSDAGKEIKPLDNPTLEKLKKESGFAKEHSRRMNEFAQEKDVYLIVRDGNPDSVNFFDREDIMAKRMSSKAKTARVGENKGLVVDPTHPQQVEYWDKAISDAEKAGNTEALKKLMDAREKALEAWKKYGNEMLKHSYQVNPKTGVIEYVEKFPDGTTKVWKGIHGDYDLHGVYKVNPDGTIEHVSYGSGKNLDANHMDIEGRTLRRQLNDKLSESKKDFVQHGAQDDWIPDPEKVAQKMPDPPATVFFPNGRPPLRLNTAEEMRQFYEEGMGIEFPYPKKVKPSQ